MIIRNTPTKNTLENLYDICNKIFKDDECFYNKEQLEKEKQKDNSIIVKEKEIYV